MLFNRVIPVLLLRKRALVKSVKFQNPTYVGDPINTVRIFNEREVDELVILDIEASPTNSEPQFDLIEEIAAEAFMPFAYGGGIRNVEQARELFRRGAEKVVVNTSAFHSRELVSQLSAEFGSQSVVVSIDCKKKLLGGYKVATNNARDVQSATPVDWAIDAENLGAGEILLTSVNQDGTFSGYDQSLTSSVVSAVNVPVIAWRWRGKPGPCPTGGLRCRCIGCSSRQFVCIRGSQRAVLVNYPERKVLDHLFDDQKATTS